MSLASAAARVRAAAIVAATGSAVLQPKAARTPAWPDASQRRAAAAGASPSLSRTGARREASARLSGQASGGRSSPETTRRARRPEARGA